MLSGPMSSDSSGDGSHGSYESYETYTETYSSYYSESDSSTSGESVPEGRKTISLLKSNCTLEANSDTIKDSLFDGNYILNSQLVFYKINHVPCQCMPDTGCSHFSRPRYASVLPAAMVHRRHKQHLEGWGADMSRRAGLGIFDSTMAGLV